MPDLDTNPTLDSAVDNLLATTGAPAPAPETPAAPSATPEPVLGAPTIEAPAPPPHVPEAEAPPDAPVPEAPELEDTDDDLDAKTADKGPNWLDLNQSRGQRIYRSYKAYKSLVDKLGFEPTIDQVGEHFERFVGTEAMLTDFTSGQPERLAEFAHNWNQKSPEGMAALASIMPEFLRQSNPDAYSKLTYPVMMHMERGLKGWAGQTADEALKKSLTHAANVLEWARTGKWSDQPAAAQPVNPELAQREQAVNQRWQQIQQQERAQHAQRWQGWRSDTDNSIASEVGKQVDEALAPIKTQYASDPVIYGALRDKFFRDVYERVAKSGDAFQRFLYRYEGAERTQSDQDRADLVSLYAAMAKRVTQAGRAELLKSAASRVKSQSDATHQKLAAAATQVSPGTAGAPPQRSITTPIPQGGSAEERRNAIIDNLLGVGTR